MPKKTKLHMRSPARTLSLKFYDEQMPDGWDATIQNIKAIDKSKWQVIGICHDRDYGGEGERIMGMPSAGDASPPRDAPGRAPRSEATKPR